MWVAKCAISPTENLLYLTQKSGMEVLFQDFCLFFFFFFTVAFTTFQRKEVKMTKMNLLKPLIKVLE